MFGDGETVLKVCICNEASRCKLNYYLYVYKHTDVVMFIIPIKKKSGPEYATIRERCKYAFMEQVISCHKIILNISDIK